MKVFGTNGKEYTLKTAGYVVPLDDIRPRSAGHIRARELIKEYFKFDTVLEEMKIPGMSFIGYFDFFLPVQRIIVEVHGEQHRAFVQHFHKTRAGFLASKKRDREKKEWAAINNFKLLELHDNEPDEQWTRILVSRDQNPGVSGEA